MIESLVTIEYPSGIIELLAKRNERWYKVQGMSYDDPQAREITQEAFRNGLLPIQDAATQATAQGETPPFIKPLRPTQPPT